MPNITPKFSVHNNQYQWSTTQLEECDLPCTTPGGRRKSKCFSGTTEVHEGNCRRTNVARPALLCDCNTDCTGSYDVGPWVIEGGNCSRAYNFKVSTFPVNSGKSCLTAATEEKNSKYSSIPGQVETTDGGRNNFFKEYGTGCTRDCDLGPFYEKSPWTTQNGQCIKVLQSQIVSSANAGGKSCNEVAQANASFGVGDEVSLSSLGDGQFVSITKKDSTGQQCTKDCRISTTGTFSPFQKLSDGTCVQTGWAAIESLSGGNGKSCDNVASTTFPNNGTPTTDIGALRVNFRKVDATRCDRACSLYPFNDQPWGMNGADCTRARVANINVPRQLNGTTCSDVVKEIVQNYVSVNETANSVTVIEKDLSRTSCKRDCAFSSIQYGATEYGRNYYLDGGGRCVTQLKGFFKPETKDLNGGVDCVQAAKNTYPSYQEYALMSDHVLMTNVDAQRTQCAKNCVLSTTQYGEWGTGADGKCTRTISNNAVTQPVGGAKSCVQVMKDTHGQDKTITGPTIDNRDVLPREYYTTVEEDSSKCTQLNACVINPFTEFMASAWYRTSVGECQKRYPTRITNPPRNGGTSCPDVAKGSSFYANGDTFQMFGDQQIDLIKTNNDMCPQDCRLGSINGSIMWYQDKGWKVVNGSCVRDTTSSKNMLSAGTGKSCAELATLKKNQMVFPATSTATIVDNVDGKSWIAIREIDNRPLDQTPCKPK